MRSIYLISGASGGIGSATATLLAQQGKCVVIHYHRYHDRAEELLNTFRQGDGEAFAVQADITTEAGVEHLFTQLYQ